MIEAVNLAEKFAAFSDHWHPRIVGELNGQQVKLARLKGEFIWHHHDDADELFLVIRGTLRMKLPDGEAQVATGEFIIVPRGGGTPARRRRRGARTALRAGRDAQHRQRGERAHSGRSGENLTPRSARQAWAVLSRW